MNKQNIYFIVLVSIFGLLSLLILYKFLIVLILAYVFSILLKPIYEKINTLLSRLWLIKKISNGLASLVTILAFILIIIVPIGFILSRVIIDAQSVYENVVNNKINLDFIGDKLNNIFTNLNINISLNAITQSISGFFIKNIGNLFSGTVDVVLKLFLFLFSMFYFLKDGKQFSKLYSLMSPMKKNNDDKLYNSVQQSIYSIMIGSLTVAVAQGLFTGLGLLMFGVPNPFFFGTLAGFLALIPGLGPSLVWFPAAIYLFFSREGSFVWLYQILWGVLAVGLIDNFLGPKVINKGIKIHPLFILLSIIGGISVLGPEGFIFGPLVLGVFVSIINIWKEDTITE